jgi:hypothetical protein
VTLADLDPIPATGGRMPRTTALIPLLLLTAACGGGAALRPSTDDTSTPVPIDIAHGAGTPSTYKGLPLALVDNGSPAVAPVEGIVGVVCIGMSNGNQECADFQSRVEGEYAAEVRPEVRIVNCAVGGHAIERWIDPAYDANLWQRCIDLQLPARGVRADQVRVIWHKAANQFTTLTGGGAKPLFPETGSDYEAFRANLSLFAARVRTWFPAVQAVYTSSRSNGGFANSSARGEPLSYEEGHALNSWLAATDGVDGVWYGWGAYIWAPACTSGETNGSGICYDRADYVDDGVHPSASGRAKVSAMLHTHFLRESWYRRP